MLEIWAVVFLVIVVFAVGITVGFTIMMVVKNRERL